MLTRNQIVSEFAPKFGVEQKHLYREVDLVDDALAGTVPTGKEFEIFQFIESLVPVHMMHSLFGKKLSSEMLFHNVPVFKNITRGFSIFSRNYHSNVTVARDSFSWLLFGVVGLIRQTPKERAAFSAAQAFSAIDRTTGAALDRHTFFADDAGSIPGFFRQSFAQSPAFGRAIQRVFSPFFAIRANRGGFVTEQFPAHGTIKIGAGNSSVFASEDSFVRYFTRSTAEFLSRVLRLNFEILSAASANLLNRHLAISYLVGTGGYGTGCRLSK